MHILRLHPEPFNAIKSGKKKSELRLNDDKRKLIKVNDNITFISRETGEEKTFRISQLNYYKDFTQAYSNIKESRVYPLDKLPLEQRVAYMAEFYSKEDELKYGVVEICID